MDAIQVEGFSKETSMVSGPSSQEHSHGMGPVGLPSIHPPGPAPQKCCRRETIVSCLRRQRGSANVWPGIGNWNLGTTSPLPLTRLVQGHPPVSTPLPPPYFDVSRAEGSCWNSLEIQQVSAFTYRSFLAAHSQIADPSRSLKTRWTELNSLWGSHSPNFKIKHNFRNFGNNIVLPKICKIY